MANATRGGSSAPDAGGVHVTDTGPPRTRARDRRRAANDARSRTRHTGRPATVLDREPVAALEAPGLEDGAAGAGRHAVAEAMVLGPAPVVRLVRPLHGLSPG